jgi:hypothetical protein
MSRWRGFRNNRIIKRDSFCKFGKCFQDLDSELNPKRKGLIMKKNVRGLMILATTVLFVACQTSPVAKWDASANPDRNVANANPELDVPWAYDPGPDPNTPMGKELIDLVAKQPNMPGISMTVTGDQMFRPPFGPTLWRMIQKPNSMKILFIGQDGTHIAEAAGRTATAGFGGRAQDLAAYFGVRNSAGFINTYAFTIKGQYATSKAPVIYGNGQSIRFQSVIDNGTWLMAQDLDSPMVKWRNSLIDWIIRNNQESLKMIVLFGGPAKDSISTFIVSKGGKVGSRMTEEQIHNQKIQVPYFEMENAGGNAEWATVPNRQGVDLTLGLLEKQLGPAAHPLDYSKPADQQKMINLLTQNLGEIYDDMQIMKGGVGGSGLVHPAQLGGYDLNQVTVNGKKTISIQGLPLSDGSKIKNEILVVDLPHPTYMSTKEMENDKAKEANPNFVPTETAQSLVAAGVQDLIPYAKNGWEIEPDSGMVNRFDKYVTHPQGNEYEYKRTDIGPEYYDFGTPKNRMVSKSDAKRMGGKSNAIILGSRDSAPFDMTAIEAASKAPAPTDLPADEMFSARPRTKELREKFDRGPGPEMARIMIENLPMDLISTPKPGKNPKTDYGDAYNIKTDPIKTGDFGHYRGTFVNPKIVFLADPDSPDDILTARALTGARGQFLQALMNDMKINDQYLVIKTLPFGMDGATDTEWKAVLEQTDKYRKEIFKAIQKNSKPVMYIADGPYASKLLKGLLEPTNKTPVFTITRTGTDNSSGIADAAKLIAEKMPDFKTVKYSNKMANIPRSHLGFFSRVWEGVGGTHVFLSTVPMYRDEAFAVVAPDWAFKQKAPQSAEEVEGVNKLLKKLDDNKIIRPREAYPDYLNRMNGADARDFWQQTNFAA